MAKPMGLRREHSPGDPAFEPLWDKEWDAILREGYGRRHETHRTLAKLGPFCWHQLIAILHGSMPDMANADAPYVVRDELASIVLCLETAIKNGAFPLPCSAMSWVEWCDRNDWPVEPGFRAGAAEIRAIPPSFRPAGVSTLPVEADPTIVGSRKSVSRCGRRAVIVRNKELHVRTLEVAQSMAADGTLTGKRDVVAVIADEFSMVESTVSRIIGNYTMPWGELVDHSARVRRDRRRQ